MDTSKNSFSIPPYYYVHILDKNSNITRLEVGPQNYVRQDHESVTSGKNPCKMVILPPKTFCQITNPILVTEKGEPKKDKHGQVQINHGEIEYRFADNYKEPFPLYPGEVITQSPTELSVVKENSALKLTALRDFIDIKKVKRIAGDEWLLYGPCTYYPRIEEKQMTTIYAQVIEEGQALKLKAKYDFVDRNKKQRKNGEEWQIRTTGFYLPSVEEEIVELQNPIIITWKEALKLKAKQQFIDIYGKERKAGSEWLITVEDSSSHILDIYEDYIQLQPLITLTKNQYCVILNPFDPTTQKNKYGSKELRKGQISFFLQPDEEMEGMIMNAYILKEDQALLLKAKEKVAVKEKLQKKDSKEYELVDKIYNPGDKWMVYGPMSYIPPIEVEVLETRSRIPQDKNEGIYVRDIRSGKVRIEIGHAYMLNAHEELWEMELGSAAEQILKKDLHYDKDGKLLKYKVVTCKVPFDSACQIYDFKQKKSRIVFGPNLAILQPDEQFTIMTLSGKTPKVPGVLKKIVIQLGPVFTTDEVTVETSDHASLRVTLSYNWLFRINKESQEEGTKIFNVKDPIADLCNMMASKIRAAVAQEKFDVFHKNSARIIRKTVLGVDDNNKIRDEFLLPKNNVVVTNVDIKNVEPVDKDTKNNLQKTVTLAIEITTKRQEATARHDAEKIEQQQMGYLEQQKIENKSKEEESKKKLLELQAKSKTVKGQGTAVATARAQVEAEEIKAQSNLEHAGLKSKAKKIQNDAKLAQQVSEQTTILEHQQKMADLEIYKQKELAQIESKKFESMIAALGQETLVQISNAGPELQAQLLQGLGLQGFIMTVQSLISLFIIKDGNNPLNLFNTAQGLIQTKQA